MRLACLATILLLQLITACTISPVNDTRPGTADEHTAADTGSSDQTAAVTAGETAGSARKSLDLSQHIPEQAVIPPDDLWLVIRDQLSMDRRLDDRKVQAKLAWFARNQEYLDRVADRATPYLYYIVEEIRRRDLPMDLALLPIVESAYQPFAYSPSRASGIWQFIPGTGKRFGLKQNWWYDGRRDIIAATDAAFRYLTELNQRFNGDWELSLAAYNAGEFKIERAIKSNRKRGKPTDYWSLKLPRETRNYVPSLLAIAEIISRPEQYNIRLKPVSNKPYFSVVKIDGQIDLARVAELSKLDMDAVYTLNPGYNRWATDPQGPHRLLLPVDVADEFTTKLAAIPARDRITWKQYTIKQGDTLGGIASRYRTSVAALKDTNRLRSSRIRAGKSLLIPVSSKPAKHYTLSQESRRFKNLKSTADGRKYIYTIKRGDTLWDIGRHYGISVSQLCRWNGIHSKSLLRLGQKLAIYVQDDQNEGRILPAVAHKADTGKGVTRYVVQEGDSLWLIARRFGVSVTDLRKWNKLPANRYLQPGQNIEIYTSTTGV
ncbi:MAG: LysM peptidoglycan-binding domain-containing protein [Thiotrichales bacterium]|nr:LysM peptidoglycan-binding domain-containing protein [Thiotrichales bacterium]